MPYCASAEIIDNQHLASDYYLMTLGCPEIARASRPGQFLEVRCASGHDPFLRRPMAVHKIARGPSGREQEAATSVSILYKVVGRGTRLIAEMRPGSLVEVTGPLGNWFTVEPTRPAIIVAGGIGVSPFPFLVNRIMEESDGEGDVTVLYGASDASGLVCVEEFEDMGAEVRLATDDGSLGHKGFVTELLPQSAAPGSVMLYGCGPLSMLRELSRWAAEKGVDCQVSLEARMGCGMGLCMSCVCPGYAENSAYTESPGNAPTYFLVCQDGPIFFTKDLTLPSQGRGPGG